MSLYLDSSPTHFSSVFNKDLEVMPYSNRSNRPWTSDGFSCIYFRKVRTNLLTMLKANGETPWLPTPVTNIDEIGRVKPSPENDGFLYYIESSGILVFEKLIKCKLTEV